MTGRGIFKDFIGPHSIVSRVRLAAATEKTASGHTEYYVECDCPRNSKRPHRITQHRKSSTTGRAIWKARIGPHRIILRVGPGAAYAKDRIGPHSDVH